MLYDILYKRDTTGSIRYWRIEQDGEKYRSAHGLLGGTEVADDWKIAEEKNIGKANYRSSVDQATSEVESEYKKKKRLGYVADVNDIDSVTYIKPMLARDYAKVKSKPTKGHAQPKLDGIRCLAKSDGLWTRGGKKITSQPHIVEALVPIFKKFPSAILDGELYNHQYRDNFNDITSKVRSDDAVDDTIQYHIYDTISSFTYEDRYAMLKEMVELTDDRIQLVETVYFDSAEYRDELYEKWISDGYEGMMIRLYGEYEEGKRSKTLLKRKEFVTEEFSVIDISEGVGNWSGIVKIFTLSLDGDKTFGAGVRGDMDTLRKLFHADAKPKWATVRYFNRTPDGVPRFPVVVDWGFDESRKD